MYGAYLICYHKHATSARTRFLRLSHGGVCGLEALPADAELEDGGAGGAVVAHPAMLLRAAERQLGLTAGSLEGEGGFRCRISAGAGAGDVYLARFTAIDPPFAAAKAAGAGFIDLTQARGLAPVELKLLRRAYEHVLG